MARLKAVRVAGVLACGIPWEVVHGGGDALIYGLMWLCLLISAKVPFLEDGEAFEATGLLK